MKITIHMEDVVDDDHNEITDPKEVAKLVRKHIAHLGEVSISYSLPRTKFQKFCNYILGYGYK